MDDKIKTPQDALEWLDRSIREEAELGGEMSNEHAIQLGFIQNMLEKFPRRNCDVGTSAEQVERWNNESLNPYEWGDRQYLDAQEVLEWAQMPYEEGGAK